MGLQQQATHRQGDVVGLLEQATQTGRRGGTAAIGYKDWMTWWDCSNRLHTDRETWWDCSNWLHRLDDVVGLQQQATHRQGDVVGLQQLATQTG